MSESTPRTPRTPRVSAVATRSLPSRANLEFERKRAKALLRKLRRDSPNAKLADAQFAVARELGFASWPRLVQYFATIERQSLVSRAPNSESTDSYEGRAKSILAEHRLGREWAGRRIAAHVPRFYGRSIADVLASEVTLDDARLVVARQHSCTSWEQLIADAAAERERHGDAWARTSSPFWRALHAIRDEDLPALQEIVNEHPELVQPTFEGYPGLHTNALIIERQSHSAKSRAITDWLHERGFDIQSALNEALLGSHNMRPTDVEYLLERGADVDWRPANGVSVLEHAIVRYSNGAALDVLARRVRRRPRGLWAAAGLGDVPAVRQHFDRAGKLRRVARTHRPPFEAMTHAFPMLPEPDDFEILSEAAFIAALNGRTAVIEVLIDFGFPIDYIGWGGTSLLRFAIGNMDVSMVEMLVRRGADLDAKGEFPHASAREFAKTMAERRIDAPELRRILQLCGVGTLEEVRQELDRQRPSPPQPSDRYREALACAHRDATHRRETEVHPDNLFVGLLQSPNLPLMFLSSAGVNVARLRERLGDRLRATSASVDAETLPLDSESTAIVQRAVAMAEAKQRSEVNVLELLAAIVERATGFGAEGIVACGGDLSRLLAELAKA